MTRRLRAELLAEVLGTYILCFFGPGAVAVAVLKGGLADGWQIASVWGFAIALAIYAVGGVSGCHINPAVSLAMAVFRPAQFPKRKILPYVGAQMVGGILAALTLAALFLPTCAVFEAAHGIVRGQPGSQLSGMWFGSYFPNACCYGTDAAAFRQVPVVTAFVAEAIGTAFLLFFVFALTDSTNPLSPAVSRLEPLFIGFAVAIVIAVVGPVSQAALNPARDLAPRIVEYFLGWGRIAIPGPRGCEWWLYIVAPIGGGLVGAGIYETLRRAAREED